MQRSNHPSFVLALLPDALMICQLAPEVPIPAWVQGNALLSIVRTPDELSLVCRLQHLPDHSGVRAVDQPWRALRVQGPLPLDMVGVLHRLLEPLAQAQISIFAVSTYDTDYILVREAEVSAVVQALQADGHTIISL